MGSTEAAKGWPPAANGEFTTAVSAPVVPFTEKAETLFVVAFAANRNEPLGLMASPSGRMPPEANGEPVTTVNAPVGRKSAAPAGKAAPEPAAVPEAKISPKPRSRKSETAEAYFPKDAVQRNAEVRKSREMKKALMSDAKHSAHAGGKAEKGAKASGKT